ncbi:Peptidase S54, rhomboid [Artemisia annua]|uniref:RHOMBOID-like protein n=2 Tax=Artemisia annua TaxID=35608 RepID=A0A2U1LDL9_ARTAN|nr:Peptidase S54, rhomboid [Artemisia annua]
MGHRDLEKNRGVPPQHVSNFYITSSPYYNAESSSDSTQWTSWLVPMIVVANVAMFIVIMLVNDCPKNHHNGKVGGDCVGRFLGRMSFQPLKENPLFGPSSSTLEKLGALEWKKVVNDNQAWRLVSCIWLHAGVVHLLANMLSLVFIGIRLEQQFGFARVAVIYMLSGIGGSVLSTLFIKNNISVGASGALFGLLGAMLSELLTNWTIYANKAAALTTLVIIILINLAVGILPHVDNFAHIGGFLTGFLLGFVLLLRPQFAWQERRHLPVEARTKSKYTVFQYVFWVLSVIFVIAGFTVGLIMLFKGENGNDHCSWCHYLSCVPTSRWHCNNR